jgi:hypothetical protein
VLQGKGCRFRLAVRAVDAATGAPLSNVSPVAFHLARMPMQRTDPSPRGEGGVAPAVPLVCARSKPLCQRTLQSAAAAHSQH